jgi:hypothetical protein
MFWNGASSLMKGGIWLLVVTILLPGMTRADSQSLTGSFLHTVTSARKQTRWPQLTRHLPLNDSCSLCLFSISCRGPTRKHSKVSWKLLLKVDCKGFWWWCRSKTPVILSYSVHLVCSQNSILTLQKRLKKADDRRREQVFRWKSLGRKERESTETKTKNKK